MKPKSRVAVMAKDSEARRVSKAPKFLYKFVPVFRFFIFPFTVYVVYGKKLERMWSARFSSMIAGTGEATISHHRFNSCSFVGPVCKFSTILHKIRVGEFSLPIPFTVRNFFFIGKRFFGFVAPNICASPGTEFIHLAFIFSTIKGILTSRADVFCFWHGCNNSAVRSHCQ